MSRRWKKTISGKTVGRGMGEGGIEGADDAVPRSSDKGGDKAQEPPRRRNAFSMRKELFRPKKSHFVSHLAKDFSIFAL